MNARHQNRRNIRIAVTALALILVLVFAPRMDGPRIIDGVRFTTKTGAPGLTNLGWVLLVAVPVLTWVLSGVVFRFLPPGRGEEERKLRKKLKQMEERR